MSMQMTPEERAIYFQDPGHGKVGDICLSLGFGDASKVGSSSRTYLAISQKTIEFRKNFVKRRGLTVFPVDIEDPAVKSCAHEFLTANEQLFDSSEETRDASWLSLPDDREQILTILCKLMCTQEAMYRKNDEYLKRKKKQVVQQESESEMENDEVDESTIRVQPKQPQPQPQPKKPEAANEADTTGTKRNIERHLEYTYPVNEVYETVPPDWLFDPQQPWPNSEQSFAFRYVHERNLYAVTKSTRSSVKRFALALTKRLNIELETHQTIIVRQRCKQLIKDISTSWGENGTGFLVKIPSGLVKSSQFENAWKFHRNSWLFKVHGGIAEGVIELNQTYPPIKEESSSRKRLHTVPPAPETSEPSPVMEPEPSSKRPRHDVGTNPRVLAQWQNTTEQDHNPASREAETTDVATATAAAPAPAPAPSLPPPVQDQNTAPVVSQPVPQFTPIPYEPAPIPKAPAFTPVNVLRSNVPAAGLQYHTSQLPRVRPLERSPNSANLAPQQQPRPSRESMPASGSVTYDLLNLSPSRLTRSKSTGNFAEPHNPGNPVPIISTVENSLSSTASSVANSIIMNAAPNRAPNTLPTLAPSTASPHASPWAQNHQHTDPQATATQPAILNLAMPSAVPITLPSQSPNHIQSQGPMHSNPASDTTPRPVFEAVHTPTQEPPSQQHQPRLQDSTRRTLTPASTTTSPIDTKPSSTLPTFAKPLSLSTPRHTETPEPSSLNTTPLSHQRLSFILENSKRSPDHDHPLSASTFRSLSQSEFFDLFCERSGRERERCEYLIFKYNWGYRDSFLVKQHGNEVEWEEIKERIRDTFFMARDRAGMRIRNGNLGVGESGSGLMKGRWQVWVMGPEDEDEEW